MSVVKVLKFGGSVLKNANDIHNIKDIINNTCHSLKLENQIFIVFSAFYKITDKLNEIGHLAANEDDYLSQLTEIKNFHFQIAEQLKINQKGITKISELFSKIEHLLITIKDMKKLSAETSDYLLAFGERLSTYIIFAYLSKYCDVMQVSPCELIKTDSRFGYAKVDFEKSKKAIIEKTADVKNQIIVCAGFFGIDTNERITTLGRNGSDYSASIIASALKVGVLEIWKDIDGLYTADPKIVKDVKFIKQISYQEMAELSSLGNKVVHINAISPCITENIPIILKNCYNSRHEGTLISNKYCNNYLINGVVKLDNVCILTLSLNDYINISDVAIRMAKILQNYEDVVITISQNIKQKIFSIIICAKKSNELINDITNEFNKEIKQQDLHIDLGQLKSMITIIGANFAGAVGISGKIFNLLEKNNININAIHDDFSKTRISFLCDVEKSNVVVNILHNELVK